MIHTFAFCRRDNNMILTKFTTYQSCLIKCLKPWPAGKSNSSVNGEGGIRKHRAVSTVLPVLSSSVLYLTYLLNIQQAKHPIKNYTTAYTPGAITVSRRRPNGGRIGRNLIGHRQGEEPRPPNTLTTRELTTITTSQMSSATRIHEYHSLNQTGN